MRTLLIGDIHGGLKALIQLLDRAEVSKSDKLIFLGDYVDGWSESAQVIDYLIQLENDCLFIKGNHDVWCEEWLKTDVGNPVWLLHGGEETVTSYASISEKDKQRHIEFFANMKLYHITENNDLFIHAGYTSMHGPTKEHYETNYYFDRTLWEIALTMENLENKEPRFYPDRLKLFREIYIGHTPTIHFDSEVPMHATNVWNVDTGAAFTGKLSALDLDTKQVFQSDKVMTLYPNEKGRNRD